MVVARVLVPVARKVPSTVSLRDGVEVPMPMLPVESAVPVPFTLLPKIKLPILRKSSVVVPKASMSYPIKMERSTETALSAAR